MKNKVEKGKGVKYWKERWKRLEENRKRTTSLPIVGYILASVSIYLFLLVLFSLNFKLPENGGHYFCCLWNSQILIVSTQLSIERLSALCFSLCKYSFQALIDISKQSRW